MGTLLRKGPKLGPSIPMEPSCPVGQENMTVMEPQATLDKRWPEHSRTC